MTDIDAESGAADVEGIGIPDRYYVDRQAQQAEGTILKSFSACIYFSVMRVLFSLPFITHSSPFLERISKFGVQIRGVFSLLLCSSSTL